MERGGEFDAAVTAAVESVTIDFGGGSSAYKCQVMGGLILREGLRTVVEIGVHKGRSLVGLATAAARLPGAHVWGIDPYAAEAYPDTRHAGAPAGLADWVREHDFEGAYADARAAVARLGLETACSIVREPAVEAAERFSAGSIDLVHIDGNHSEETVRADVETYLPRIRPGGYVVLDDISWPSVRRGAEPALASAERVFELTDLTDVGGLGINDFRICRLPT